MNESCQSIQSRLRDFLREQMPAAERQQVQEHLAHCGDCQARLREEKRLRELFASLPRQSCPADLRSRLEQPAQLPLRREARSPGRRARWSAALSVAVAALLVIALWPRTPAPVDQAESLSPAQRNRVLTQYHWSLALVAAKLHQGSAQAQTTLTEYDAIEIINSALAAAAKSPLLRQRRQSNGG